MATGDKQALDSGHSESGVAWEIGRFNLRYANVYYTNVNGSLKMYDNRDKAYAYLQDSNVTSFRRVVAEGKTMYEQSQQPESSGDGDPDSGDDV